MKLFRKRLNRSGWDLLTRILHLNLKSETNMLTKISKFLKLFGFPGNKLSTINSVLGPTF